ncbi:MAG TPA: GNAT family N-acetyltransferase [Rhizomicrobium sp.]|jgi:ribosomal protein S18 acetylase RimI-like enzyme|nr:GNAT family N-acetyltransferase [Rhizomicrobium sp.]
MDTPKLNALVEETCMNAWPALKEVFYDGWLIRLANGATRRTNSVNVIGPGHRALGDKIAYCESVYRAHAQPTYFRILSTAPPDLDSALVARGYAKEDETRTLYMNFRKRRPPKPASDVAVDILEGRPSRDWLAAYQRLSRCSDAEAQGRRDVLNALSVPAFFAEARDDSGEIASVGFGAFHDKLICLQWVVTDPAQRRKGLSRAALSALLRRGRDAGATGACLQVVANNHSAIALYESLGFDSELYRYHYRVR